MHLSYSISIKMLIIFLAKLIMVTAVFAKTAWNQRDAVCPVKSLRTSNGAPVYLQDTVSSLTSLNLNAFFIESMAHFVRERIVPRVVHAKGVAAFGYFKVTHNVTDICEAKLFDTIGKLTPVAVRFSLPNKEVGEADTVRDAIGFAVKFYTEEGNFDMVGLNSPMFSVKDPLYFIPFSRALRKNPKTHLTDPKSLWNMATLRPESAFLVMNLFTDNGTPDGYRHIPGFSIHTYQVYNKFGESYFVRFNFDPNAGIKNLSAEEAEKLAGSNPEYATKDLYNSIENGDFPSWKLRVQVLSSEDIKTCKFDPFDVTQIIPENEYPWIPVGDLVLNENPTNYFAQVEQLIFCPNNLVPGILGAPDQLFESRRISYREAQSYRLGENFNKISVNRPVIPVYSYLRDGVAPVDDNGGDGVNYFPNNEGPFPCVGKSRPKLVSVRNETTYNFDQAANMYLYGMTKNVRSRMIKNIVASLAQVDELLQKRAIDLFSMINSGLGYRIQAGLADMCKG